MRNSCGTSGQVRPLKTQSGKGLTECPAESEQPETEINYFQELQSIKTAFFYGQRMKYQ
ncbi:hypothetical protein [Fictibacillus sp. UD]|uniref:hypothetical protein n=1 Tax=Fictibacillus sp. UD TaxID=3038777 RepID=UPI003749F6CE